MVGSTFSFGSGDYDIYLLRLDWDKTHPGPVLPDEVVAEARRIYDEARTRLFA